jgi:hypothetical protein
VRITLARSQLNSDVGQHGEYGLSIQDHTSLSEAAVAAFPAGAARVLALSASGDDAYVLVDVGSANQPYLYGVVFARREGIWREGGSGNGPGWSRTSATEAVGTLAFWDDAPPGSDRARIEFAGSTLEVPIANGVYLATWWRVPSTTIEMPRATSLRIEGRWIELD